jgi:hypothetical protein
VYGIAAGCAERRVLGPDVDLDIEVIDETKTRIDIPALLPRYRRHDDFGCVALIGVQSKQYPRALDIARPFRAAGIAVAIGGFLHRGARRCRMAAQWISTFATTWVSPYSPLKPRGVFESVIADVAAGRLAPIYNYMKDLPFMEGRCRLPKRYIVRTLGSSASFDAGRGLPLCRS